MTNFKFLLKTTRSCIKLEGFKNNLHRHHKDREITYGTYSNLILDTGDVEKRSDLLPQFVPWPCAEFEVFAQVSLADLESQTLFLQFLEFFPGEVTTYPRLHPGDDFTKTVITKFFHLTQDTGTEEYLNIYNNT